MSLPNITVLLPAYDEEGNIGKLIPRINKTLVENKLSYNILVVDDGSTDKTGEILEKLSTEFPLSIARHARNRGLGTALKTGFNEILSKKKTCALFAFSPVRCRKMLCMVFSLLT